MEMLAALQRLKLRSSPLDPKQRSFVATIDTWLSAHVERRIVFFSLAILTQSSSFPPLVMTARSVRTYTLQLHLSFKRPRVTLEYHRDGCLLVFTPKRHSQDVDRLQVSILDGMGRSLGICRCLANERQIFLSFGLGDREEATDALSSLRPD